MKISRVIVGFVVIALLVSGCAAKSESSLGNGSIGIDRDGAEYLGAQKEAPVAVEEYASDSSKTLTNSTGAADFQQMVIMNANLSIAVDDPTVAMAAVQKLAKDMGGFTVSSNLYKTQTASGLEVPEANVTIRVPSERLDEALKKIKDLTGDPAKFVLNENISGQDVTQEYTDLQSRLRNLEEANDKLTEFYEKATKTEDALAIYNQKMQVSEQIEVLKGQIQYYEQSAAKSAITVSIQAKASVAPITVAGWQPSGVARKALQALINFGKGLVDFLIWLGILVVPVLLVIGLPVFFFIRWLVRRDRKVQANRRQVSAQKPIDQNISGKPPLPPKDRE